MWLAHHQAQKQRIKLSYLKRPFREYKGVQRYVFHSCPSSCYLHWNSYFSSPYRTADQTFVPSFVPTYYVSILQSQISFVVLDQASLTLFLAFLNDYQSISADPRRWVHCRTAKRLANKWSIVVDPRDKICKISHTYFFIAWQLQLLACIYHSLSPLLFFFFSYPGHL